MNAETTPTIPFDLSDEEYRQLYRDLVLVRRIDTEATALQRQGELGLWAQLVGQEAAQVGAGRALIDGDMAFPTYREHGVAWCRDVDPLTLLGLFRGTTNGGWSPQDHGFALYTIVIGDQCPQAVGYAMGIQHDGAENAVMVFFGDGASSQGDVNEAFIWASVFNAPVVFFCQNNQWAISEPLERQTRIPLYQRALGFGFPGVRVDGNDVLASALQSVAPRCSGRAKAPAHRSSRPSRIEWVRTRPPTIPSRYRLDTDVEAWKLRDPLERVRSFLHKQQLVDQQFFDELDAEAEALGGAPA